MSIGIDWDCDKLLNERLKVGMITSGVAILSVDACADPVDDIGGKWSVLRLRLGAPPPASVALRHGVQPNVSGLT
eukprot:6492631-Amphidinium_carterae.1